jgi:hypothetical protein
MPEQIFKIVHVWCLVAFVSAKDCQKMLHDAYSEG